MHTNIMNRIKKVFATSHSRKRFSSILNWSENAHFFFCFFFSSKCIKFSFCFQKFRQDWNLYNHSIFISDWSIQMQNVTVLDSVKFSNDLDFERQVLECKCIHIAELWFRSLFSSFVIFQKKIIISMNTHITLNFLHLLANFFLPFFCFLFFLLFFLTKMIKKH